MVISIIWIWCLRYSDSSYLYYNYMCVRIVGLVMHPYLIDLCGCLPFSYGEGLNGSDNVLFMQL